jgi:CRISPR type I-E-associated protein CasB/Cse2
MKDRSISPSVSLFFDRMEQLDAGGRARFKRNAGRTISESTHETLGLFYGLLPSKVPEIQHELYFLAATLYPFAESGGSGDVGAALRRAKQIKNARGLDRRIEILLDADETQLAFRLRQAIHFMKSCGVRVNFPLLLQDLLYWTHPDRFVQSQWAQSYFSE